MERAFFAEYHLFVIFIPVFTSLINRQILVVTTNIFQGSIQRVTTFLTLTLGIKVFTIIIVVRGRTCPVDHWLIVSNTFLKCRIIVQLCFYPIDHLLQRQLDELRLQQLQGRDGLQLPLLLFLLLYLTLWHLLKKVFFQFFCDGMQLRRLLVRHALPYMLTGQQQGRKRHLVTFQIRVTNLKHIKHLNNVGGF